MQKPFQIYVVKYSYQWLTDPLTHWLTVVSKKTGSGVDIVACLCWKVFLQGDLGGETRVLPRGFKAQVFHSFSFSYWLLFLSTWIQFPLDLGFSNPVTKNIVDMKIHLILSTKWISENIFQKMNICGYLCTKWILKSIPEKLNSSCYPKHRDSIIQVIVCWLQERRSGDKLSRAVQKVHHLLIHTSCHTWLRKKTRETKFWWQNLKNSRNAVPLVPEKTRETKFWWKKFWKREFALRQARVNVAQQLIFTFKPSIQYIKSNLLNSTFSKLIKSMHVVMNWWLTIQLGRIDKEIVIHSTLPRK